jgi:general stress protein 26
MFGKGDGDKNQQLQEKFWDELADSPFLMLGLQGVEDSRTRPMSAQLDGRQIYFFAARSEHLFHGLAETKRAVATFASKGHKLFAHIHGTLAEHQDRALIDRLWNPFVASWYKDGKDDPDLVLLKFDTEKAELWEAAVGSTLKAAALKMLFDIDPGKEHQQDHKAQVKF